MTREEAIKILKAIKVYECYPKSASEETKEAIDMAIEALSAEEAVWNEYEAEFTDLPDIPRYYYEKVVGKMAHEINMLKEQLESADAVMRDATAEERASVQRYIDSISNEAVQVVRCKDCEYADFKCPYPVCNFIEMNITDNDFCSWGERREE